MFTKCGLQSRAAYINVLIPFCVASNQGQLPFKYCMATIYQWPFIYVWSHLQATTKRFWS